MIQYTFFPADGRLSEYLFSYGTMEIPAGATSPLLSPPNGLSGFLIRVKEDKNASVVGKDFEGKPIAHQPNYVIGQTTLPITGHGVGHITFLIVFFQPLGMYQLFGCNMASLTNKSVDLIDFLGSEKARMLIEKLKNANDWEEQSGILNDFLLSQKPLKDDCSDVKKALELIHSSQGNINVKSIETTLSVNRRSLERHFKSKVGISPKVYVQVYRFKCAMNFLQANPNTTWASLTYNNGFFDQPHMIRYFKEYLKVSPNNLVTLDMDFINYLLKH